MSQSLLTVKDCWDLSKKNYSNINSNSLIRKSREYTLSNADLSIIPTTTINNNKNISYSDKELKASLIKNYYKLSERIIHLYYSIILLRRKLSLNKELDSSLINLAELTRSIKKSGDNLEKIEIYLKALNNRRVNLTKQLGLYYDMLSNILNKKVDKSSKLEDKDIHLYIINKYGYNRAIKDYKNLTINKEVEISYSEKKVSKIGNGSNIFSVRKPPINYKFTDEITQEFLQVDIENKKIRQNSEILELSNTITRNSEKQKIQNNIICDYYNQYKTKKELPVTNLLREIIKIDNQNNSMVGYKVQLLMATKRYNFTNIGLSNN